MIEGVVEAMRRWDTAVHVRPPWRPLPDAGDELWLTFHCGCQLVMRRGDDPIRQWGPCRHGTSFRAASL